MAIKPVHSTVTVTTAGTRVQCFSDADTLGASIYFEALGTNTGYIYVGLVTVTNAIYIARLSAGQGFNLDSDSTGNIRLGGVDLYLTAFYVDSSVSGEKVQVTYLPRVSNV